MRHSKYVVSAYLSQLIEELPQLAGENFQPATTGTRHDVYLSTNFVIRSRRDDSTILREAELLKSLKLELAPKIVWSGTLDDTDIMVEERLLGEPADIVWPNLTSEQRAEIGATLATWLLSLRSQANKDFTAVSVAAPADSWPALLTLIYRPALNQISQSTLPTSAQQLWSALSPQIKKIDSLKNPPQPTLTHGDPTMHNLLVNNGRLSGVIDWEFSLYGDTYYDYARLLYYRDCALAYGSTPTDYHGFESSFYDAVWQDIKKEKSFDKSYFDHVFPIYEALFFARSLAWALDSKNPAGNSAELLDNWEKKRGPDATRRAP